MKVQVLSDLHQEFGMRDFSFSKADIVVFAGDVNVGLKGINWMLETIPDKPVIYVLGNHEYYGGAYPKTLEKIKLRAHGTNVHVLENECINFGGVNFHGTTLWTDFSIFGNPIEYGIICQGKMNDYKKIRRSPSYSKLRTVDTYRIHQKSITWLEESLNSKKGQINFVVTHHAPSLKSIPERFKEDQLTSAYASNLDEFILAHQPDYWIHGHIHDAIQYQIGGTKVICNPHGYIDEKAKDFNPEIILEISVEV